MNERFLSHPRLPGLATKKKAAALCNTSVSDAESSLRCLLDRPDELLQTCKMIEDYLNSQCSESKSRRNLIDRYRRKALNALQSTYNCNVLNCGNGHCIHELTEHECPHCGCRIVRVKTTGVEFCSNHEMLCDYESPTP